MPGMNDIVPEMDFEFFSAGEHGMSVDGMRTALNNDHFLFLDVRSEIEAKYVSFPFAMHIPFNELPERLDELPKDKCIVTFCSSVFRGATAYAYLLSQGFDEVRGMVSPIEDMVMAFKPGPLGKM